MKEQFPTQFKEHINITEFIGSYYVIPSALQNKLERDTTICWQLFYVFHGTWKTMVEGREISISKNEFYLFRPQCVRDVFDTAPLNTEFGIISFMSNTANLRQIADTSFPAKPEERKLFKNILELTQSSFEIITDSENFRGLRPKASTSDIVLQRLKNLIESLLLSLYSHLDDGVSSDVKSNTFNRDVQIICEIESYMMQHLGEPLSVEDIANHTFLSVSKIKRTFKNVTGHGAMQHFNSLKIDRAMELIRNGSHNFSDIADMLGFESLSYFSFVFKQKTGYTPSAYSRLKK